MSAGIDWSVRPYNGQVEPSEADAGKLRPVRASYDSMALKSAAASMSQSLSSKLKKGSWRLRPDFWFRHL